MAIVRLVSLSLLLAVMSITSVQAAEKLQGQLTLAIDGNRALAAASRSKSMPLKRRATAATRRRWLTVRHSSACSLPLEPVRRPTYPAQRDACRRTGFRIDLPEDLATGWYLLIATVVDDEGNQVSIQRALSSRDHRKFLTCRLTTIRGQGTVLHIAVHTEHHRCVYSPGEEFRVFVSARGQSGVDTPVIVGLYPLSREGRPTMLARGQLSAGRGEETTLAFDIGATASAMIAPGDYRMTAIAGREVVDSWRVRFITAERPSGGARWATPFPMARAAAPPASSPCSTPPPPAGVRATSIMYSPGFIMPRCG